jgi:altronate dehydratase small subunit
MGKRIRVIVLNEKDNVATALEALTAGSTASVELQGRIESIKLVSDIPMGHKFALRDMEEGTAVIKYGEPIGRSAGKINRGEHVHVHNVANQPGGGSR